MLSPSQPHPFFSSTPQNCDDTFYEGGGRFSPMPAETTEIGDQEVYFY